MTNTLLIILLISLVYVVAANRLYTYIAILAFQGVVLGQNALAMSFVTYVAVREHRGEDEAHQHDDADEQGQAAGHEIQDRTRAAVDEPEPLQDRVEIARLGEDADPDDPGGVRAGERPSTSPGRPLARCMRR